VGKKLTFNVEGAVGIHTMLKRKNVLHVVMGQLQQLESLIGTRKTELNFVFMCQKLPSNF
jgi:hypothetical protein